MNHRPETKEENLRCYLSPEEKATLSEKLVRMLQEIAVEDENRAEWVSEWKGRMESLVKLVNRYRDTLAMGYEYRYVECRVMYNTPHSRTKTIFRPDTGEVVREEEMSDSECQENLPLENHVNQVPVVTLPGDGFKLEAEPLEPPPPELPPDGKAAAAND